MQATGQDEQAKIAVNYNGLAEAAQPRANPPPNRRKGLPNQICRWSGACALDRGQGCAHRSRALQPAQLILGDGLKKLLSRAFEMQHVFPIELLGGVFLARLHGEIESMAGEIAQRGAEGRAGIDLEIGRAHV